MIARRVAVLLLVSLICAIPAALPPGAHAQAPSPDAVHRILDSPRFEQASAFIARDYERFVGKLARVTILDPETRTKRTVVSRLAEFRPDGPDENADGGGESSGTVVLIDDKSGERTEVSLKNIRLARLEIEL